MIRKYLTIALGLLTVSAMAQQPESLPSGLSSIADQRWRILRLAKKKEDGFHFVGTGFVVTRSGRAYIVTCAHLIEHQSDAAPLYADFPYPLNAHRTTVAAKNYDADLAVLTTDVQILPTPSETTNAARQGMQVFVVGFDDQHMQKDNPQIQSGIIATVGWWEDRKNRIFTSKRTTDSATPALLIYGPICQPGESGSPVFGADGQIIGVTTAFTHDHNCLATTMPALVDLLAQIDPFD